ANFNNYRNFIGKHDAGYVGTKFGYNNGNGKINFYQVGSSGSRDLRWTTLPPTNTWTYVTLTSAGTGGSGFSLYYNGIKQAAPSIILDTISGSTTNSSNCNIGSESTYSSE